MGQKLNEEQWKAAFELAHAAAEVPVAERRRFLDACGHEPVVIQQALILLEEFDPPTQTAVQPGSTISHFVVTGHLGSGGMGDVYAATDTELRRPVALKFLRPEASMVDGAVERFIREGRTASMLNHPNIVTIYEVIRTESSLAIVMELVEGKTLREVRQEKVGIERLLDIGEQIANALAAAHAAGIIHRDIKPENIIVRPDGRVKVMDFGLARWIEAENRSGIWVSVPGLPVGTWRYMSPEQCRGESLTGATDIFSLGIVLHELCTGRPFSSGEAGPANAASLRSKEVRPPSAWNPEIPKELDALVLRMLAQEPAARPDAEKVANAFSTLRRGADPNWTPPQLLMRRSRRAVPWVGAIAAATALAAAAGVFLWRWNPTVPRAVLQQVTTLVAENHATAAAISPDGRFAAYANVDGVFLRSSQSGETVNLRQPESFLADRLAWFPDGTKLAVSGFSTITNQPSVWAVSITGMAPRLLREEARAGVPSFDGTQLASLSEDWSEIWVTNISGERPRKVLSSPASDTFTFVCWAADGRHLIFQRRHYATDQDLGNVVVDRYYRRSLEVLDLDTGKVVSSMPEMWADSAVALKDGTVLLLKMDRGSDSRSAVWEIHMNPRTGVIHGSAHEIQGMEESFRGQLSGISCTADGNRIMFVLRNNAPAVYVADYSSAPPSFLKSRRLTLDDRLNFPHAWTPDSAAVIFESDRSGNWDIFKQRTDQRLPDVIVNHPARAEVLPQVAGQGKWMLYSTAPKGQEAKGLDTVMRVPLSGGTPEQVQVGSPVDTFRCGIGPSQPCVIRRSIGREYYAFHALDPEKGIGAELARTPWMVGVLADWDVSPDGSLVALPNHDNRSATIRLVRLDHRAHEPAEWTVELKGLSDLSGLTWSADGTGWFVSVNTTVGKHLYYVYLDGRRHLIGDIQGWAVPSPDGRRVAYLDRIVAANAWMIERH
jgi:Tol biopolymer transport system component/predicted Ser/Thr protein kinase